MSKTGVSGGKRHGLGTDGSGVGANGGARPRNGNDLQDDIPFWMNLETISGCQRAILQNWTALWTQGFQTWTQLAPTNLWQNIFGGWNVSLFQVIRNMKGNPAVESRIVKEVAGYGSQLGTLTDYVGVVAKREGLSLNNLDAEDAAKYVRFHDMVSKIDQIKKQPVTGFVAES